jgi:hypothetical protein
MSLSGSDRIFCGEEKETSMTLKCWKFKGWKSRGSTVCAIALVSFAAGSLITARLRTLTK